MTVIKSFNTVKKLDLIVEQFGIVMSATVLATDILSNLYDNDDDLKGTGESREDVVDDLNYDIFNLVAFNYHPVRFLGSEEDREDELLEAATRATQLLIKRSDKCNTRCADDVQKTINKPEYSLYLKLLWRRFIDFLQTTDILYLTLVLKSLTDSLNALLSVQRSAH